MKNLTLIIALMFVSTSINAQRQVGSSNASRQLDPTLFSEIFNRNQSYVSTDFLMTSTDDRYYQIHGPAGKFYWYIFRFDNGIVWRKHPSTESGVTGMWPDGSSSVRVVRYREDTNGKTHYGTAFIRRQ